MQIYFWKLNLGLLFALVKQCLRIKTLLFVYVNRRKCKIKLYDNEDLDLYHYLVSGI